MTPKLRTVITQAALALMLGMALSSVNAGFPLQSTGGTLRLSELKAQDIMRRTRVVSISLQNYSGPPMTACQFRVTSSGAGRIVSLDAGAGIADRAAWKFASSLRSSGPSSADPRDTARAVLYGKGLAGAGDTEVARIVVELAEGNSAANPLVLGLENIIGAHATGDNAGVIAGSPLRLSYQSSTGLR